MFYAMIFLRKSEIADTANVSANTNNLNLKGLYTYHLNFVLFIAFIFATRVTATYKIIKKEQNTILMIFLLNFLFTIL